MVLFSADEAAMSRKLAYSRDRSHPKGEAYVAVQHNSVEYMIEDSKIRIHVKALVAQHLSTAKPALLRLACDATRNMVLDR